MSLPVRAAIVAMAIDLAACEGIYVRPTNARADDRLRRNRSTQYFSYPGYDFDRLRREAPWSNPH